MFAIIKYVVLAMFVFILSACETHKQTNSIGAIVERPTLEEVAILESQIVMPKGAFLLKEYTRYYAFDEEQKARVIIGLFSKSATPKIRIVGYQAMPQITDGGCSIIHVRYDVVEKKITAIICGGVA